MTMKCVFFFNRDVADDIGDGPIDQVNNGGGVGIVDTVWEDTGTKNAIRGKVWRGRNGDCVRYVYVNDGADYRPEGKSLRFLILYN